MTLLPLVVQDLRKAYRGRVILDGVSFVLRPGEAVALLGSNGAGKSTLLGCLTGDRLPDGGSVRVCGADPFSDPVQAERCMGVDHDHPILYCDLMVGELLCDIDASLWLDSTEVVS